MTPYYAAMTRRWHTNEHLSHTVDPVGYHGGRMAILALMFWPDCSKWILAECVCHDLGEYKTGDRPFGCRDKDADAEWSARHEMSMTFSIRHDDRAKMKFLDSLDAYLWAQHHAAHVLLSEDWQEQRKKILATSHELGVSLTDHGIEI